ncbi:putative MFS-type transporter [Lachnellula suecica]|uniref:Putative MFS-type transporter n=1 Tax=Lachnellula suecica TaxID=602035 RepID=A0A8T9BYH6_9HELO|nr:putative MFS-type transporter [Lachnellula suecica]
MASTPPSPPMGLKWRSSRSYILFTIGIAMFTDLFLYGIIVPTLPFILRDRLQTPHSQIQYLTSTLLSCFAISSVITSLPAGILADKLPSRQIPFLGGLLSLLGATILLYVGRTIAVLIVARVLQGVAGAVVWTVGLALIRDTVGTKNLGVTIGFIFSFVSVGELLAPVAGGILYDKAGNGAVFGLAFGLLVIDLITRIALIEKKTARKYGLEDEPVSSSEPSDEESVPSEDSPLLAKPYEEEEAWKIPKPQPNIILKFPILYALGSSRVLTAQLVGLMQATLIGMFDSTIPTESSDLFGFSSLQSGLLFIPLVVPYLIFGGILGKAIDKYGPRVVSTLGFAYFIIPLVLLRIPQPGGTAEVVKFSVFLGLSGLGLSFISAISLVEVSKVMEKYHEANKDLFGEDGPFAQMFAINSMVFSAGLALGPLIAGTLRESVGYGNMAAVMAGMCAIVSVLSWIYLGKVPKKI